MPIKEIVITGASKGIGFETALFLAEKGHRVTAISRSEDLLENLRSHVPEQIRILPIDITTPDAGSVVADFLSEHSVKADILIHNAGLLINKPFSEQNNADLERQFEVNALAPFRITRDILPHFNSSGHIVCISSMGGFQGSSKFPGLSAYSASKGALSILSECLAAELSEMNIACNTLCLGAVQTKMLEEAFPGFNAPVEPSEMGPFIGDFCLNGNRFYNGQILPVTLGNPG
ncbi:SDR family NAD(P)-dependent oxidoreductase [Rhodohalobacter mucosus]|uniref:Short-chain dehydrogenase n=1 Tax=Rhodohalobacter mucosus TaxID=2079485 RepID=A0A316TSB7_9BACT|nr:SDR family oxidoreductase [Rhodohalobacter mucosus]PWN05124.1 short-chain dehydrogenase [Rhodohalobacter mucosus]